MPTLPAAATRPAAPQPTISAYRRQLLPAQSRPLPDYRRRSLYLRCQFEGCRQEALRLHPNARDIINRTD